MKATRDVPIESEEAREEVVESAVEVAREVVESVIERGEVWSGIKGLRMSERGENRSVVPDREKIGPSMKE